MTAVISVKAWSVIQAHLDRLDRAVDRSFHTIAASDRAPGLPLP